MRNLILSLFLFVSLWHVTASSASGQPPVRRFSERRVFWSLVDIQTAQNAYRNSHERFGSLGELRMAGLIGDALASGSVYGYRYEMTTATNPPTYEITAVPQAYRRTGILSYYTANNSQIRGGDKDGQKAIVTDPLVDDCSDGTVMGNERCSIADMKALFVAQSTYFTNNQRFGTLSQLQSTGLIRAWLSSGTTAGYVFTGFYSDPVPPHFPGVFKFWAQPRNYGSSAVRSFFIDQTGVLRGADRKGGPANENDPPITN